MIGNGRAVDASADNHDVIGFSKIRLRRNIAPCRIASGQTILNQTPGHIGPPWKLAVEMGVCCRRLFTENLALNPWSSASFKPTLVVVLPSPDGMGLIPVTGNRLSSPRVLKPSM